MKLLACRRSARARWVIARGGALLLASGLGACTSAPSDDATWAPSPCTAGDANTVVAGCEAGIEPEQCADGFVSDGAMGCEAVLPADACPEGQLALPGETTCHPIAPCGDGAFGDIPVEAGNQYVDANYAGGDSDGTEPRPWLTIAEALAAAAPGTIVAIAAGSYSEDLRVADKAVRLWGVCPERVEIVGSATPLSAVLVAQGADGTELRSLAIRGASGGLRVEGSAHVVVEQVWIHDTADRGVTLQAESGAVSATIRDSLVERATVVGVQVIGASVTIERSSIRDTDETDPGGVGQGLVLQPHPQSGTASHGTLQSCVLERNHTASIDVLGSTMTVEASVVRSTEPSRLSSRDGVGILAVADSGLRASLTVRASLVHDNYARGIAALGSDLVVETTHVRDTYPQDWDQSAGEGIAVQSDEAEIGIASVTSSLVERSRQSGVLVRGSEASFELLLVRDTQPRGSDDSFGRGIAVLREEEPGLSASAELRSCRLEGNRAFGLWAADAQVTVDSTLFADTAVQRSDGDFGDGLAAGTLTPEVAPGASLTVTGSRFDGAARAGITVYGAALSLEQSTLECNAQDMRGANEYFGLSHDFAYQDRGGNLCGCGTSRGECAIGR